MKDKIKIFVDAHVFDGISQGTTTYLNGLYNEMKKNDEFEFYFAGYDTDNLKKIFGEAHNIQYLKYKYHNKFYRLLIDIPRLIRENKIDFAHFQYITPFIKNTKFIVTLHDLLFLEYPQQFPLFYRLKNKFLFYNSAKSADILLTVSEFSKKSIEKYFGLTNIQITPNAVNPIYFEDYIKEDYKNTILKKFGFKNYFLYVSRIEPRKNHHTLVEVFFENEYYKNFDLVFVGNKAITYKKLDSTIQKTPTELQKKIHFYDNINHENLLSLFRGASLFVYPSLAEGFGIPPLEAVATMTPTVSSNTTAMEDFYFLKENSFDPLNKGEIHKKIAFTLSDSNLQSKKNELMQNFNWEHSAKILENIILNQQK